MKRQDGALRGFEAERDLSYNGRVLILVPVGNFVGNPPRYDPIRDLTPITIIAASTHMLVVHPVFPARTVSELVALAKANPGKVSYASPGGDDGAAGR